MPPAGEFAFGPYRLDTESRRLFRSGEPLALSAHHFDILAELVSRAGQIVTKEQLLQAAWQGVAVGDNSVEKGISHLRQTLDADSPELYIATFARRGYGFTAPVTRVNGKGSEADLDDILAPHRALIDGRAALETLELASIERAGETFRRLLALDSQNATFHVGFANVCILRFESTRADATPAFAELDLAVKHAREACRLDPAYSEAWATLGFILGRTPHRLEGLSALREAARLEPDNWRHQLRLAYGSWGEECLRAARRSLLLMPANPLARLLAASVYVARDALGEAEREIDAGIAVIAVTPDGSDRPDGPEASRFSPVALHWLKGLLCLARGAEDDALAAFERELALEPRGHFYARECCANAWYAIGACHWRRRDPKAAREAFEQAIARVPQHPMAHAGLALLAAAGAGRDDDDQVSGDAPDSGAMPFETALAQAIPLVARGDVPAAVRSVRAALAEAPAGNAGWLVPIEPFLGIQHARDAWTPVLALVASRAS